MKSKLTPGALCALFALASTSASAAVLVNYAMTADGAALNAAATASPTTTAANVAATALANQAGGTFSGSFNYNNGADRVTSWAVTTGSVTNFANAFAAGSYIAFSITPEAGYEISLSSITFQAASGSTSTTSDRAFYLVTATSPAGFTAASTVLVTDRTVFGGGTMPVQNATVNNTVPKDYGADLTSLGAISSGQTQYFRLYIQAGVSQALTFDDIVINGTVTASAVPEPSTYAAFAGAAGLGLAALRRRRRG